MAPKEFRFVLDTLPDGKPRLRGIHLVKNGKPHGRRSYFGHPELKGEVVDWALAKERLGVDAATEALIAGYV